MSNTVLWETIGKKAIITSRSVNTLVKLVNIVISKLSTSNKRVCLVLGRPELARYLASEVIERVEVVNLESACRSCTYTIVLELGYYKSLANCSSEYIYVFTQRGAKFTPRGFTKIYVKSITMGEYLLIAPNTGVYARFTIRGNDLIFTEHPAGIYGKALEALRSAMATYGELTIKDSVRVLVHELRVEKAYARRIIEWLASRRYIRVIKGRITMSSV
ncbi:MAG: hypothetical protein LM556_01180 [Desulfurococcaceae archaeon]|jgi:hypothetical protein|nr:hypothetical protein [Desulfurococcaceae archaeon]